MNALTSPLVSIAIPTYKGEATLGPAIESVLAQTLGDLELIIVDDASPDGTRDLVAGYRDARIVYHRNETNLRPQGNWNRCLDLARGRYFKLLPHDDLLHPRCLELQARALARDVAERLALVFSARTLAGPTGKRLGRRAFARDDRDALDGGALKRACALLGTNLVGEPGAVMFRTALARKVGPFDATNPYVIDLDYWFRLLDHGDAGYCAQELAAFRVSAQSWSFAIGDSQDSQFVDFISRMGDRFNPPLSALDRMRVRAMAKANKWLRFGFYALYLR